MPIIRTAKIEVSARIPYEYKATKYFTGTPDEIYAEAIDWMNVVALRCIEDNNVTDPDKQHKIIDSFSHWIEYDNSPIEMFAVLDTACDETLIGVYPSAAEAQEMVLAIAEEWVYTVMMTENPYEVNGHDEWDWHEDYYDILFNGVGDSLTVVPVAAFGVALIEE